MMSVVQNMTVLATVFLNPHGLASFHGVALYPPKHYGVKEVSI